MLETLTGHPDYDDTWQYSHFMRRGDAQDKKFHVSATAALRGGWNVGLGVYWETFGWDSTLYANYRILSPAGDTLPFTGVGRISNRDYVFTLATPQWSAFNATLLYVGGQDENFFEWAQANINLATLTVSMRPSDRVRLDGSYQYQDYWRRTDDTLVGRNVIPRLKVEYQLTRSIFLRVVGEYDLTENNDSARRDADVLSAARRRRSDTRDAVAGSARRLSVLVHAASRHGVLSSATATRARGLPDATQRFNFQPILRTSDYFFVKYSYLFRV